MKCIICVHRNNGPSHNMQIGVEKYIMLKIWGHVLNEFIANFLKIRF